MIITIGKCLVPECAGASHKWEFETPTLRELQRMEKTAGISIDQFAGGLDDALDTGITSAAINAVLALVDILHRRNGVRVPFEDIDVDPGDFHLDLGADETDGEPDDDADTEAGKGPDPTPPSHPHEDTAPGEPASGPSTEAESEPRSSSTPPGSGGGSASP